MDKDFPSQNLFKTQPAITQLVTFRNSSYIEAASCESRDTDQAYLDVYKGMSEDNTDTRLCKPRVICTFDRNRYPPVIYQVECGTQTKWTDPFICKTKKNTIHVLRRFDCKDAEGNDSEQWRWDDSEVIHTGCKLKSKCELKH